jgi:hypothetical protein
MVGAGVLSQVRHRNQHTPTNSSCRQAASRYQVIQRALADGENLRSITPTQEQLLFGANFRFLVGI